MVIMVTAMVMAQRRDMGFSLFSKNKPLGVLGFFKGFSDLHSHLLPGVDDGVQTMSESLKILEYWEQLGAESVWCTPHIMEDVPNTTDALRKRFADLQQAYKGSIRLYLGAENMLDALFRQRMEKEDILSLDNENLLVETSIFGSPFDLDELFDSIQRKGYYPLLAHPERYRYMSKEDYLHYQKKGIRFQLNLLSLGGFYGTQAKEKAFDILDRGWYYTLGTDLHNVNMLLKASTLKLENKVLKKLEELKYNR